MKAERVVLDTNVLISAALSTSTAPARVVQYVIAHARIVFSTDTFAELETRLWRPKFDRYLTIDDRRLILHDLSAIADWVSPQQLATVGSPRHSRDPDDDKFIWAALAGDARLLISGDRDLLDLRAIDALSIRSPAQVLDALGKG